MSLHVASELEMHPICGEYVMHIHDRLALDLQKRIDSFGERFGNWYYVLDLVGYFIDQNEDQACDLTPVIQEIKALAPDRFAYFMLGLTVPELAVSEKEFSKWYKMMPEDCLKKLRDRQYSLLKEEAVLDLLQNTDQVRQKLIELLEDYWKSAFFREWELISAYVKDIIAHEELSLSHTTLFQYLKEFHPQLQMENDQLIFNKTPRLTIRLEEIETLIITPSVFGDNHLHGNIYGRRVNMLLNLNYRALQISRVIPEDFFQLLHVLSDESRFKILKVLWNKEATTKEISEILRLSPSTISLHLKLLKEADLVSSSKIKKYVYYRLKKERLMGLQQELLDYLKY